MLALRLLRAAPGELVHGATDAEARELRDDAAPGLLALHGVERARRRFDARPRRFQSGPNNGRLRRLQRRWRYLEMQRR